MTPPCFVHRSLIVTGALLLSACAQLFAPFQAPASEAAQAPAAPVVVDHPEPEPETDYFKLTSQLRQYGAAELAAEGERFAKAYAGHRSEANRLRLALFLSIAPAPYGERNRALALLDVAPNDTNGRGRNHPLAQLLLPVLHELRRAEDNAAATQQKLRDQQQAFDAMRQKLDALREIELRIQERPKNP